MTKSARDLDTILHTLHNYNINPCNNEIYLFGEESYIPVTDIENPTEPGIEYSIANKFIRNLNFLQSYTDKTITIHMKTCGGDWQEGMSIYDAIKTCKNKTRIINYTHASSMSSIIFLAANEQIMHKHSTYMFHMGTIYTGGTVTQFRTEYEQNEKATQQMLNVYVNHLKTKEYWKQKTEKQIRNWLIKQMQKKEEVYLSAEEAVEYGFADKILE